MRFLDHLDPDCTGTWHHTITSGREYVWCDRCPIEWPATEKALKRAARENEIGWAMVDAARSAELEMAFGQFPQLVKGQG